MQTPSSPNPSSSTNSRTCCCNAVLSSYAQPHYFLGFYFWLDVVSTVSLIFQLPAVIEALGGVGWRFQGLPVIPLQDFDAFLNNAGPYVCTLLLLVTTRFRPTSGSSPRCP